MKPLRQTVVVALVASVVGLLGAAFPAAARADDPTTFDAYEWVADPDLPAVLERPEDGSDEYKMRRKTVVFPINVWGGWAPLIAANRGFNPGPDSVFAQKYGFMVKLVVVEDSSDLLTRYVNGETPILWGTTDMMVLFASRLATGPRPKVFQQIDWSNGGDGILVRSGRVRSANDLRGKTVVVAPFSPSHYYLLTVLDAAGVDPGEVTIKYTKTAFGAARAFWENEDIDACVSFAPDIYTIPEAKPDEFRLLSSTADAKRLIADVWAVREDFAAANPNVIRGLVDGIFEGMDICRDDPDQVAKWMYAGYGEHGISSADECKALMGDAHLTNWAENRTFFTDARNPTSFDRLWDDALRLYREAGAVEESLPAKMVADTTMLDDEAVSKRWKHTKDDYTNAILEVSDEARQRLAARRTTGSVVTMVVYFGAADESFDENSAEVAAALEEVARLAGKFGGALVLIEGYTDPISSGIPKLRARLGDNPYVAKVLGARERRLVPLSSVRAEFVKRALGDRYGLAADRFHVEARGGERPVTEDFEERWKNRRVEITILTVEGE